MGLKMSAGKKDKNSRHKKNVKQSDPVRAAMGEGKAEKELLNHEQQKIARWLKNVKFRKAAFGGVDERDVWKRLEELNAMYEAALSAERARYDALLRSYIESDNTITAQCRQETGEGLAGDEDAQK